MARKTTTKTISTSATEGGKDWTYLADKAPTDLHYNLAKWIEEQTGVAIDPKAAQLVAVLRIPFQKSEANKTAEYYRGLEEAFVEKRSEHMTLANSEAREIIARDRAEAQRVAEAAAAKRAAAAAKAAATRKAKKSTTAKVETTEA